MHHHPKFPVVSFELSPFEIIVVAQSLGFWSDYLCNGPRVAHYVYEYRDFNDTPLDADGVFLPYWWFVWYRWKRHFWLRRGEELRRRCDGCSRGTPGWTSWTGRRVKYSSRDLVTQPCGSTSYFLRQRSPLNTLQASRLHHGDCRQLRDDHTHTHTQHKKTVCRFLTLPSAQPPCLANRRLAEIYSQEQKKRDHYRVI